MGDVAKRRKYELELIKDVASRCKTAVVTGPAAARWLGLSTYRWVETVDLALPGNSRTWGDTDRRRVYHGGLLREAEYLTHNGVRTATAIRAMFDTFRYYGRIDALVQIESARFQHDHLTTDYLLAKTETLTRARGIKPFRELLAYSADTSASALETIARDTLLRHRVGQAYWRRDHRVPGRFPDHGRRRLGYRRVGGRAHQRVPHRRGGWAGKEQRRDGRCGRCFTT